MSSEHDGDIRDLFDEIFERTAAGLLWAAERILADSHHAEDVVQEAYAELHRAMEGGGLVQSPDAWLRRVVLNGALNRRKREAIRTWRPLWNEIVNGKATPAEERLAAQYEQETVDGVIDDLPEQQRKAYVMCVVMEMSFTEIGEIIGCRDDTAREYVQAAHTKLFAAFRPYLEEE